MNSCVFVSLRTNVNGVACGNGSLISRGRDLAVLEVAVDTSGSLGCGAVVAFEVAGGRSGSLGCGAVVPLVSIFSFFFNISLNGILAVCNITTYLLLPTKLGSQPKYERSIANANSAMMFDM